MTQPGDASSNSSNPWQPPIVGGSQPGRGAPLPGQGAGPYPGSQPPPHPQPAPPQFGAPQAYPQQTQGFPPPGPGNYGAEGYIDLTLQGSAMTSNMLTPKVTIDGHPVPAAYGLNHLPVPAGRHTVSAHATWIVSYGKASYDVEVRPGQSVPVFYAAPLVQFAKGNMGPTKQKRNGKGFFVGVLVLVVVVALAMVVTVMLVS